MYKTAVIGLGNIGMMYDLESQRPHPSTHVRAYEMSSEYSLICGIDADVKKKDILHDLAPSAEFFSSIDDAMAKGVLNEVDVVSVCTPPSTHLEIIKNLIASKIGRVIFCEKPIVENLAEAEELREMVQKSGITVVPNISRRWNTHLDDVKDWVISKRFGDLEKINIRYTKGIYNTGAHLFDLLRMWTGNDIKRVMTLGETKTSAYPEKSYSFYFMLEDGATGYAEAINDENYYLFDIDLYFQNGKIEIRNSGDDIICYKVADHHLFGGFKELSPDYSVTDALQDNCMKNSVMNIYEYLNGNEELKCRLEDAIYPLYVAKALEESEKSSCFVEVIR